jgi:hypothetical protein
MSVSGEAVVKGAEEGAGGSLATAIDELLALDPDTLDDAGLADVVVGLRRHQARLAAATPRLTGAFEARRVYEVDGSRRTMAWPDFCRAVEYWRQHADPDGVERDAAHDEALRRCICPRACGARATWMGC